MIFVILNIRMWFECSRKELQIHHIALILKGKLVKTNAITVYFHSLKKTGSIPVEIIITATYLQQ